MMDSIVQWATILSPIIAVLIAWWMSRSSAKDTAKQIAALEESTTKQVESIKALSKQQIDATIKHVDLEIEKNLFMAKQAQQEWEGIQSIKNGGLSHIAEWRNGVMKEFQENKPERDYQLYSQFVKELQVIKQNLETNKKKLD